MERQLEGWYSKYTQEKHTHTRKTTGTLTDYARNKGTRVLILRYRNCLCLPASA